MSNKINKPLIKAQSLIHEIIAEGMQQSQTVDNIVTFADEILNLELWPTQRAILKALYNLPLERGKWSDLLKSSAKLRDEREAEIMAKCQRYDVDPDEEWDEREILQSWALQNKTTWVEGSHYNELCLEAGMRSSKSSLTSVIVCYEFYKVLQHKDPAKSFGLMPGSLIGFLVLAASEEQAQDTLFAAIKGRVENSPYFQGLITTGMLQVNSLEIVCSEKNLRLWAGHSKSSTLVGRTLMMFAMDEGNRFESSGGASGLELSANVGKGTTTLQKFGSKKILISSAWQEGDATDVLYDIAETDEGSHILAFRLCTWDINPEFAKLGEEHPFIRKEYLTRGIEAKRDYAGIRPGNEESFFSKPLIDKITVLNSLPVVYEPYERTVKGTQGTTETYSAINVHVDTNAIHIPVGFQSYGHCDPGLKHDSFGFVAVSPVFDQRTGLVNASINTVIEWRPVDKGRKVIYPVDMQNVEDIILELAPHIALKQLTFDHWQSAFIIQRLYSKGVVTKEWKSSFSQAVQREIYLNLRDWIYAERIQLPDPSVSPAAAKLYKELTELKLMNGRRIDHPKPRGSKDLCDALACAVFLLAQDERKYRSFEIGSDKMRSVGQVRAAHAISEIFDEGRALAELSNRRMNKTLRNDLGKNRNMIRKTSITQFDW